MDRNKLLMIFGGAWLSAALLTWFLASATSAANQTKTVQVMGAARDLSAGTKLRKGDLKVISIPAKDQPRGVFADEKALLERTLLFPVGVNEAVTMNRLAAVGGVEGVAAIIPSGKRAVSVQVTDATSAAGLIQPRAHVDVIYTRSGSINEAVSKVVLEDVVVLSVGRSTEVAQTDPKTAVAATNVNQSSTQSRAVTLLVNADDAAKLELAKNNGKIGLVLRNPLDAGKLEQTEPTYADSLDPYLGTRRERMLKSKPLPGAANAVNNDRAWAGLTANPGDAKKKETKKEEEPPKPPQKVIDVYRGDKHVQEVFEKTK
jgi:pilus assembly protein CpaB